MVTSGSNCSLSLAPWQHSSSVVLNDSQHCTWIHFRLELRVSSDHRLLTRVIVCTPHQASVLFLWPQWSHVLYPHITWSLVLWHFPLKSSLPSIKSSFTLLWFPSNSSMLTSLPSLVVYIHFLLLLTNLLLLLLLQSFTHNSAETILAKVTFAIFVAKFIGYIRSLTRLKQ